MEGSRAVPPSPLHRDLAPHSLSSQPHAEPGRTADTVGASPWPGAGRVRWPAVRWLIDGMNVIGTRPDAWWKDRDAAMLRLVDLLERWVSRSGEDVTVVFERPPSPPISSSVIEVAHAPRPRPNSADDEIVRRLSDEPEPARVRVVTSDRWLADRVRATGATVESAAGFRERLEGA